jgi:hypothetical protein
MEISIPKTYECVALEQKLSLLYNQTEHCRANGTNKTYRVQEHVKVTLIPVFVASLVA